ncbi:HET-domain-containing protein [Xylariaceae sp. AK1471]|nr:HET-domain-containing protein [Xylariaceae sp. AK1471]
MSNIYRHLDRQRKEIRLLQLLSSPRPQYARIPICRLMQTSLLEDPQYNALSYAWGDPEANRMIVLDNIPIRIPRNLFDALIALRPDKDFITIWVDFLCIDQQNNTEKSWQVGLMNEIYSHAKKVLAWLGPADAESEHTMKYLDAFGTKAQACGFYHNFRIADSIWRELAIQDPPHLEPGSQETLSAQSSQAVHESLLGVAFPPLLGSFYKTKLKNMLREVSGWHSHTNLFPVPGMKRLFTRVWFKRVWVLQEIALSERAKFICGSLRIDRDRLCAALNAYSAFRDVLTEKVLANTHKSFSQYHELILSNNFHHQGAIMTNMHRLHKVAQFPLIALLRLTCVGSVNLERYGHSNLDSSDPRDKIFALLGLASDREDLRKKGIYPDYKKSCYEVYTSTAFALLQQGHLSLLSYVQYPRIHTNLPSWVPDWYTPITEPLQVLEDDHMTVYPEFCASGTITYTLYATGNRQDPATQDISLESFVHDKVHRVGCFAQRVSSNENPTSEPYAWPQEWLVEILRLTYQTQHKLSSFDERLRAAARTSVGGVVHVRGGDLARVGEDRFVEAAYLLRWGVNRVGGKRIKSEAQNFLLSKDLKERFRGMTMKSLQITNEINGRSLRRLPFVTSKGHLGLGNSNIREGDDVVIIRGAQVPYILRPQQAGAYHLVSEAYVDGIMDGEALQGSTFTRLILV